MTNTQDFKEASEILQNVDVSEIFTSLALAIAKTQAKLDENSINQLVKLAEYKLGGKSLLELGFTPAFYCVSEANINAYISLKMAAKESLDVKVGLNVSYSTGGLDKAQTDLLNSKKDANGVEGYKSGKTIAFLALEYNKVKIEGKDVVFDPCDEKMDKKCISMVEEYENLLNGISNISEVRTTITLNEQKIKSSPDITIGDTGNGYLCISYPEQFDNEKNVVLKVTNQSGERPGELFEISASGLEGTLKNIAASEKIKGLYAFSKDGKYYTFKEVVAGKQEVEKAVDMSLYFNNEVKDKKADRIYWDNKSLSGGKPNESTLIECYQRLVHLLNSNDETLAVTGCTTKSDDTYTKNLGDRRAQALVRLLKGLGVITKIDAKSDNSDTNNSRAKIELKADYIVLDKQAVTEFPKSTGGYSILPCDKNKPTDTATISNGEPIQKMDTLKEMREVIRLGKFQAPYFSELLCGGRMLYLLNEKAMLSFQLLSSKDSIKIETEKDIEKEKNKEDSKDDNIVIKEDFSPASKLKTESPDAKDSKNTFAIAANIDVRYARSFEMSMEGNASMSAKIKSVPPPDAFKEFVLNTIK